VIDLEPSIVLLTSGEDAVRKFGTGFVIATAGSDAFIVTCAHVVRDVGGPDLVRVAGRPAQVVAAGPAAEADLAVLRLAMPDPPPVLPLHTGHPGPGRGFRSAGFQSYGDGYLIRRIDGTLGNEVGLEARDSGGRVQAWELALGGRSRLQPGYSGSPIVDRATGRVFAVASHREGDGQRGLAISIAELDRVWPGRPGRAASHSPPAADPSAVPSEPAEGRPPVFIGRDRELGCLSSAFRAARDGRGTTVFVTGEPGSGKSTLVTQAIAGFAESDSHLTTLAQVDSMSGRHLSYAPFKATMEQLLASSGSATGSPPLDLVRDAWAGMGITDLGPLASFSGACTRALQDQLHAVAVPSGVAGPAAPTDFDQGALFGCYWKALSAIASQQLLVLVLEDLHWADESSLLMLTHLGRAVNTHRILLICTLRPDEAGENAPLLAEVQDRLIGQGAVRIDLPGSADRGAGDQRLEQFCVDYLQQRYGTVFDPEVPRFLHRLTRANPLFLTEILADLEERGAIRQADGGWRLCQPLAELRQLPVRVEHVIRQRVGRLSDDLLAILKYGSVEGESFTAEVISQIQGVAAQTLVRTIIDRLMHAHRLVAAGTRRWLLQETRVHTFSFSHVLTQRYIYDYVLSAIEREMLHEEVGLCLERLWGESASQIAPQLATHFSLANLPEPTVRYALLAAQSFVAQSGWSEVTRFARLGLTTWRAHPELAGRLPLDVLTRLSVLYARGENEGGIRAERIDHVQAGIDALRPCLQWNHQVDRELAAEVHLTLGRLTASQHVLAGYDVNEHLVQAAKQYEEIGHTEGLIAALSVNCYDTNVANQGLADEQLARRRRVVALAEAAGQPLLVAKGLCDLALHYLNFDSDEERPLAAALDSARRAVAVTAGQNAVAHLTAQLHLSWVYHHCGFYQTVLPQHRQLVLDLARQHGQTVLEAEALTDLGHLYSLLTHTQDAADQALRAALEFRRQTGRHTLHDRENLAAYLIRRGEFEEATRLLAEALDAADIARSIRSRGLIAWMSAASGHPERARSTLREVARLDTSGVDVSTVMRAHSRLGEHATALGLAEQVARIAPRAARRGVFHIYADHATELAEVYQRAGDRAAADHWLRQAERQWATLGEVTDVTELVMYWEHRLVWCQLMPAERLAAERLAAEPDRRALDEVCRQLTAIGHYAAPEALRQLERADRADRLSGAEDERR
jgi:tetratricopeptide (TPR) repeat protein